MTCTKNLLLCIKLCSQGGFHLQLLLKKITDKQSKLKIISRHLLVLGVVSVVNTLMGMQGASEETTTHYKVLTL